MSVARSLLAVLTGFAVIALSLGLLAPYVARRSFSIGLLVSALTGCVLAAMVGGYLTALIAGRRELPHAATVGVLIVGVAFVSMRLRGEARPGWYEAAVTGCGPVAALFGAGLRRLRKG